MPCTYYVHVYNTYSNIYSVLPTKNSDRDLSFKGFFIINKMNKNNMEKEEKNR